MTEPPIDYRELLKAYMRHVLDTEGTDFIFLIGLNNVLNPEQKAQLKTLSDEVKAEP